MNEYMYYRQRAYTAYTTHSFSGNPDDQALRCFTHSAPANLQQEPPAPHHASPQPEIVIMPFSDFYTTHPEQAQKLAAYGEQSWQVRGIYSYADAFAHQSLVIYVRPGTLIAEPIALHKIIKHISEQNSYAAYKIVVGSHARVSFTNTHISLSAAAVITTLWYVEPYANLCVIENQESHDKSLYSAHLFACEAYSTVNVYAIFGAGSLTTQWIDMRMHGSGAHLRLRSIGIALQKQQQLSVITEQHHTAQHTTVDVSLATVVGKDARSSYHGRIHIAANASHSESKQRNPVLLLAETARATSVPSLEALVDEVHCVHATAMGTLDTQQMQYLQSRGLSYEQARRMLVQGFLQTALSGCAQADMLVDQALESPDFKSVCWINEE